MRKILYLLTLFTLQTGLGQKTPANINKTIGIQDSLTYKLELRVYKDNSISNAVELLRFYNEDNMWKADLYRYFSPVSEGELARFTKESLQNLRDDTWGDIIYTSNILDLPYMEQIRYKLEKAEKIHQDGKTYYSKISTEMSDGTSYYVQIRDAERSNILNYGNPENYRDRFPDVDELQSFCLFLSIIRDHFNIWRIE